MTVVDLRQSSRTPTPSDRRRSLLRPFLRPLLRPLLRLRVADRRPVSRFSQRRPGWLGWPALQYAVWYAVWFGVAAVFLTPLVWLVAASLRPVEAPPPTRIELWPVEPTLANYTAIFALLPYGRYAANSVAVTTGGVALTLLTASMGGFALAQLGGGWRRLAVAGLVGLLLAPPMSLWLGRFLVFRTFGWLDTLGALLAPALLGGGPFYLLLFYWAFRRIPLEVYEAARLDGCDGFRLWWSIGLPLIRPAILAVAVIAGAHYWSEFLDPLLYINNSDWYTLPVALRYLQQLHPSRWPLQMAGAVVVTLPVFVVFWLAQRYFLRRHFGQARFDE